MSEHLSEAVVQSLVAALVVEALLRLWGVSAPHLRLAWRLGALAGPPLLLLAFEVLAPFRHGDRFAEGPALLATRHLGAVALWGVGLDRLWPWPVWALGLALLGRDLLPLLAARASRPAEAPEFDAQRLTALVASLSAAAQVAPPPVVLVAARWPLILCVGVRRPRLLVSPALLESLDEGELAAAVAHELSHLRRRDVLWSWGLLALRGLQALNPVAQVLGRVVALETEQRADADAAQWTGRPATVASAVLKVFGAAGPQPSGEVWLAARLHAARVAAVEARCRRLLAPPPDPSAAPGPLLSAAAALGLATLLFFVT